MKKTDTQTIILLDAHAIIHRAYHAMPDFMTSKGVPTGAIYGFGTMVLKIIEELKPDHIIACYDLPGPTFRHESFAEYKGTRSKTDDALKMQFDATREICEAFAIPIYDAPGFEADDILGTLAVELKKDVSNKIIIASGDLDTMQLIDGDQVQVYTLKKGIKDTIMYNEQAVFDRFGFSPLSIIDYKAFRGDPSDNIPGIKGVGEKTATTIIQSFNTMENVYTSLEKNPNALTDIGLTPRLSGLVVDGREQAEFSKIIATIRTDVPINFSMPKDTWKDAVDTNAAKEIFDRYELRALPGRLDRALGIEQKVVEQKLEDVQPEQLHRAAVILGLLDSDKTDADLGSILDYTQKKNFTDAEQQLVSEIKKIPRLYNLFTHIEEPLINTVSRMSKYGMSVDQNFFKNLSKKYHSELERLQEIIFGFAGSEFNIKSPKQLSQVLFVDMGLPTKGIKKSKTGSYSTNIDTLEKLHDEHEIIQKIMEYRELEKLLSTYIDVIPAMVGEDQRLHAEFLQNGTVTGRFSSKNPNLQNIPTRTELGRKIREGFVATKEHQLVSFDYSQVELRVLAILSGDETLIQIFKDKKDIHTAVASLIGGVSEVDVDREMRRKAKIVNFGILYGMGINSLRKEMGTTKEEAQQFYNGFFTQFPRATAFLESTKQHARDHGYTETLFGRRRQFKKINSKLPFIRAMAERMALNAPIQGTAADMIKCAMVHIDTLIQNKFAAKAHAILQIHDEIVYEVHQDIVADFAAQAETIMMQVLKTSYLDYESPVPFVVHYSAGEHWGELK